MSARSWPCGTSEGAPSVNGCPPGRRRRHCHPMDSKKMTGGQKARLRGIGQRLDATLKVGKEGLTPALLVELRRQLAANELVKIRFLGADRTQRPPLCLGIEEKTGSICVGSVGQTALFHVPRPAIPGPGVAAD